MDTFFTWGANSHGQLGIGDDNPQQDHCPTPQRVKVDIEDKKISHAALGTNHSILLTQSGDIYTFGNGENHQLGHGNTRSRMWPSLVVRPKIKASAIFAAGDCSALFVQNEQSLLTDMARVAASRISAAGKKPMSVFVGTWNCNGKQSNNLANWLLSNSFAPDIIVIGLQEIVDMKAGAIVKATAADKQNNKENTYHPWKHAIEQTLSLCSGSRYVKVKNKILVGMMLLVFVKEEHAPHVKDACGSIVPCGAMGKIGNKGGVGIRFSLYKTGFCFINSHLAAGESNERLERRAQDFKKIQMMSFDGNLSMLDHECLIWLGDLNYRIDLNPVECKEKIKAKNWQSLVANDQLTYERNAGRVFLGFQEQPINFAPTYKYDVGTNQYDSSEKNRTPSYCDRILYRGDTIKPLVYQRHELTESDHRPVSSLFLVEVQDYQPASSPRAGGWTRIKTAKSVSSGTSRCESPDISNKHRNHNHVQMCNSLPSLHHPSPSKITIGNQHSLFERSTYQQQQQQYPIKQLPIPPVPPKLNKLKISTNNTNNINMSDSTSSLSSTTSTESTSNNRQQQPQQQSQQQSHQFVIGSLPTSPYLFNNNNLRFSSPGVIRKLSLSVDNLHAAGGTSRHGLSAHRRNFLLSIGSSRPDSPTQGSNLSINTNNTLTSGSSHTTTNPRHNISNSSSSYGSSDAVPSPKILPVSKSTSNLFSYMPSSLPDEPNFLYIDTDTEMLSSDSDSSSDSESELDAGGLPNNKSGKQYARSASYLLYLPLNFSDVNYADEDEEDVLADPYKLTSNGNGNGNGKKNNINNNYIYESLDDNKSINHHHQAEELLLPQHQPHHHVQRQHHQQQQEDDKRISQHQGTFQTFLEDNIVLDNIFIERYISDNIDSSSISSDISSCSSTIFDDNNNNNNYMSTPTKMINRDNNNDNRASIGTLSPSLKSSGIKWISSKIVLGGQRRKDSLANK
ncbi:hypothetical protein SAMD00019534_096650 [Acytostelium subglobosum LB1]|uniref:hypothetical protein n=1 Tax=Acytostelium subglobosum LB1 TaxID=1410327 RepID=UPI0006448E72|nr:hypothetical protein SAMD00019534_096650 [Acytostelium subglobosum LB1]GAM26490.1 hypothetical protein SAMD00019534_096650 [Acytostelium subglobosum LB1]|eukprot:XP_012750586.1 hypothetical protein SAMD00019534_096650 [Acytostelium subglobosum LB1]